MEEKKTIGWWRFFFVTLFKVEPLKPHLLSHQILSAAILSYFNNSLYYLLFFFLSFFLFVFFLVRISVQFNHISTSWPRCQILFGIYTNTTINNDNCCIGVWTESIAGVTRPRRSMGSSSSCSWYYRIIFAKRYRFSTRRFARLVSREWRIKGMFIVTPMRHQRMRNQMEKTLN